MGQNRGKQGTKHQQSAPRWWRCPLCQAGTDTSGPAHISAAAAAGGRWHTFFVLSFAVTPLTARVPSALRPTRQDTFFDPRMTTPEVGGERIATALMFLNEPEEGGETVFPGMPVRTGKNQMIDMRWVFASWNTTENPAPRASVVSKVYLRVYVCAGPQRGPRVVGVRPAGARRQAQEGQHGARGGGEKRARERTVPCCFTPRSYAPPRRRPRGWPGVSEV